MSTGLDPLTYFGYKTYEQGKESVQAQKDANAIAQRNMAQTQKNAEQAFNKANRRRANPFAALMANATQGLPTLLTGSTGVNTSTLPLARNTLLGG